MEARAEEAGCCVGNRGGCRVSCWGAGAGAGAVTECGAVEGRGAGAFGEAWVVEGAVAVGT